jgi:L-threonylcarbamoyladenylate synthase
VSADPSAEAADAARRGELIVFPTDTVYGIGTCPDDPAATGRLFDAKRRPRDLTLPILVADLPAARLVGVLDDRAERLAAAAWPGGLTLVVPRAPAAEPWDLGGDRVTVGLRMPAHPVALDVLSRAGPLAVTSANRSGAPPARTCDELHQAFGELVSVYLCRDEPAEREASTVIDLAHGGARILRRGALQPDEIRRVLPAEEALLDSGPSS